MTSQNKSWAKVWREARRTLRRAVTDDEKKWAQAKVQLAEKNLPAHQIKSLRGESE